MRPFRNVLIAILTAVLVLQAGSGVAQADLDFDADQWVPSAFPSDPGEPNP